MIVVDIETSGLDFNKCGIWQIGALDLDNPENTFLEEARIDDEDVLEKGAARVTGRTEEEMRDKNKQSQRELLISFLDWAGKIKGNNLLCEGPQFDLSFITLKSSKYGLKIPFHYQAFDLHSLSQLKYFQINKRFLFKEEHSDMGLPRSLQFCGIEDPRRIVENGIIVKEGKPHNALEDSKLTAECFSRIVYGKNLLKEYSEFKVPDYLEAK